MKKAIITALTGLISLTAQAQSFTIPHDTIIASAIPDGNGVVSLSLYNDITNITSSPIFVDWRILHHDLPYDWKYGFNICDNHGCYAGNLMLAGVWHTTDTIKASKTGSFKLSFGITTATTMGTHYVQVEMVNGTDTVLSTYIVTRYATSVANVELISAPLHVYPNPATDKLTVLTDEKLRGKKLLLFARNGQLLSETAVTGTNTDIDVSALSAGLYFARLLDDSGQTVGTAKFSK